MESAIETRGLLGPQLLHKNMVAGPYRVETQFLGPDSQPQDVLYVFEPLIVGQREAEFHSGTPDKVGFLGRTQCITEA